MTLPGVLALGSFPMSNPLKTLMAALLVLVTGLLATAPGAVAHNCNGVDPPTNCGECVIGQHDHNYADHSDYCESDWGFPGTTGRCVDDAVGYETPRVLDSLVAYAERHVGVNGPSPDGLCVSLERGTLLP